MADSLVLDLDRIIDIASGKAAAAAADVEHRGTRRCALDLPVALVQWTAEGGKSIPALLQAKDISSKGIGVSSRYMLHVGHEGVVLLLRPRGEPVVIGVKVVHSRYAGRMTHESGLAFIPHTEGFTMDDFRDAHGHLPDFVARSRAA